MQYDWTNFYTEFATKLLPFKADRKASVSYTHLTLPTNSLV